MRLSSILIAIGMVIAGSGFAPYIFLLENVEDRLPPEYLHIVAGMFVLWIGGAIITAVGLTARGIVGKEAKEARA